MTDQTQSDPAYGMWVILAGLAAMTAVTIAALVRYDEPNAIVTALGPVTGVVGSLVGAYFGLRGSSLAQQHATNAELARAALAAPPSSNGNGDPGAIAPAPSADEAQRIRDEYAAPSDADDDLDLPDPEDVALDATPPDEGDDRGARGTTS